MSTWAFRSAGPKYAVDEPGDSLVQPQREEQVVARDRIRHRDRPLAADRRRDAGRRPG